MVGLMFERVQQGVDRRGAFSVVGEAYGVFIPFTCFFFRAASECRRGDEYPYRAFHMDILRHFDRRRKGDAEMAVSIGDDLDFRASFEMRRLSGKTLDSRAFYRKGGNDE